MDTFRIGPGRRRVRATRPPSPELLERRAERARGEPTSHVAVIEPPAERRLAETLPARVQVVCRDHGPLWDGEIACKHEHQEVVGRVAHSHQAAYGAGCPTTIDVYWWDL